MGITCSPGSSLLPDGSDARGLPSEPAPRLPGAARGELSALMRGEFSDRVSTAGLRPDGLADTKRGVYVPSSSSSSCLGVGPPSPRVGAGGAGDGRGSVRGDKPNSSLPRTPPQLAPIDPSPPPLPAASISSRSIPDRGRGPPTQWEGLSSPPAFLTFATHIADGRIPAAVAIPGRWARPGQQPACRRDVVAEAAQVDG